jgi:hypothetical protein
MIRLSVLNTTLLLLLKIFTSALIPDNNNPDSYDEYSLSKIVSVLNIKVQPADQTDCKGNKATFSVLAEGNAGTMHYQWLRKRPLDESFVSFGAKDSTKLPVYNIGTGNEAPNGTMYQVLVSDQNEVVTSSIAYLTVNQITGISPVGIANFTLNQGVDLQLKVLTSGNSAISYQWIKKFGTNDWRDVLDDSVISGSQSEQLSFMLISVADSGIYKIRVTFPTINGNQCTETSSITRKINVTAVPDTESPIFVNLSNEDKILCQRDLVQALWNNSLNGIVPSNVNDCQIKEHSTIFDQHLSHFSDNATPADKLILHWGIYTNGNLSLPISDISGTILDNRIGQISLHPEKIIVISQPTGSLQNQIVFWLEDMSGNLTPDSLRHKIKLTVAPRPEIIRDF